MEKDAYAFLSVVFGKNLVKHCGTLWLAMGQLRVDNVAPRTNRKPGAKNMIDPLIVKLHLIAL